MQAVNFDTQVYYLPAVSNYLEKCGSIVVGQFWKFVFASDDDAFKKQISDADDDFEGRQITRVTFVDVEDLLSVPDHALQVTRQDNLKTFIKLLSANGYWTSLWVKWDFKNRTPD